MGRAVELFRLRPMQAEAALAYHAEFTGKIRAQIGANRRAAQEAEELWHRQGDLLADPRLRRSSPASTHAETVRRPILRHLPRILETGLSHSLTKRRPTRQPPNAHMVDPTLPGHREVRGARWHAPRSPHA